MSLTTPYLESYLTANGVDITFGFSFDAISENYVRCLVYMPDGAVITPNFTVDVAAGEVSIVSMTTPDGELLQVPPEGATVRIYREAPESQDATASVLQAFTSKQLEKSLDKIVATVQQVDYKATHKTVRTTETERDVWLDKLTDEHNDELLKWDESGHKITTSGLTEQEIRNTTAQATTTADEAKAIATEARTTANEANSTSNDAKSIAQNAATDAANAVQTATDATNVANAANATAESAKTTATNASTKADAAVSTANSALQKANTAMVQSSDALADAAVSLENSEQAVATANEAKNTADGIDGKATSALTNSEQAVATANAAKTAADSASAKATAAEATANTALDAVAGKQDKLTAGDNIIISGNVISATSSGVGFDIQVVQELPATGQNGIIYLVAKDGTAPDVYDEYVWIESTQTFELIGTTQVDLSDYATKTELATGLNTKQNKLVAGTGITIENDVISSTGGTVVIMRDL